MSFFFNSKFLLHTSLCLSMLCCVSMASAVMDPRFELDPSALSSAKASSKPTATRGEKRRNSPKTDKSAASVEKQGFVYTVKAGDNLFKILMRDYGLNNDEAESFVEEIKRENNIYDIKRLKIGQKITIPPVRRRADGSLKLIKPAQTVARGADAAEAPGQSFALESPIPMLTAQEAAVRIRETWDKLVPARPGLDKPISLQTQTFSLSLDPQRYPTFAAMDGSRILLDQGDSIPPLVRNLIQGKDPSLRIVSGPPAGTKRFLSSMLEVGGFYSVEENFNVDFGSDPKLTFHADFKIEKSSESLGKQDIVLMNSGLNASPAALGEFLKKEGFALYEPFASLKNYVVRNSRPIHQITSKKQPEIVDAILKAFSVSADRERRLDVFAADNNGISLAVKAERYFERGGQRFVITSFDGDPVNYTLFRILETKGYRVVILEAQDDFRKISEKVISSMKVKGSFAKHNLLQNRAIGYSLQMSGFSLDDASLPGGGLFLTNLELDRIVRDLLTDNGYNINSK